MNIKYPIEAVHTLSVEETITALETNAENGISPAEAEARTAKFGANIYAEQKQKSVWFILLLQFKSPIVYLLLFAMAVTLYFQNYIEAISIAVVIFVNALIGFFMELQARSSMNALKEMDVILSNVIRDGKTLQIPSEKITVGDLIVLEAGDVIPGDARLVEANQLQCDESSLTGESLPLEKSAAQLPNTKDTSLLEFDNICFMGTNVVSGTGMAIVVNTGNATYFGTIGKAITGKRAETSFDKGIKYIIFSE